MTTHPSPSSAKFGLQALWALVLSFGVTLLVLSLAYIQDLTDIQRAPGVLWLFLCGVPTSEPLALPLLLSGGTLLAFIGLGGLILHKAPPAVQRRGQIGAGMLALTLIIAVLLGRTIFPPQPAADPIAGMELRGSVVDPPRALADFTLTGHTGEPISLSSFRGSPVLLFFGYTYCPDICPATLSDFHKAAKLLGPDAERVKFVFISVDGDRDTPERLARYVQAFGPEMIGMTGAEGDIRRIGADYGLYFARKEMGADKPYLVDHTATAYLINQNGELVMVYPFNTPADVMAADLHHLLGK